ncbi:ABC transporter permease [uncultured Anaerotruncus sp.]|uniref:ABC transporter permease n=1 Tax=uncultured Anaerotruncus sp. TaxID=905011 RepID=UPI00280A8DBC|nr:ABC transporter permease [uncultured Anaerotruncus sp.]
MNDRTKRFWSWWDRFGILAILLAVGLVFLALNARIVSVSNLTTVLSRSATTGIAAAGMTFAICAGGFDLSVGSILSLVTCVVAMNIANIGMWPSILLALLVGVLCGVVNGLIITKLHIQTFVATLATQLAFKGAALVYSNGKRVLMSKNKEIKIFSTSSVLGIPVQVILVVAVFVIAYLVYRHTRFGVKTRAIGSNEAAARASGINVDRTLIAVFVVTGLTAACAGVLQSSRLATGSAIIGDGFELDVITSVILGGTALSGGKGNIWGSFIGALLLSLIRSGLNILGVDEAFQKLAIAVVLLFALSISGIKIITQEAAK